jgi:hypothetical protein
MTIKKTTRGREYWEDLIQEFNNCKGISLKEFCALNEVGFSTFCRWKSKLSQESSELKAAGSWAPLHIEEDFVEELNPTPQTARDNPSEEDDHNDLCDLQSKTESTCKGFDLHIGEKIWLKVPVGFNEFELKRLVGVLC